MFNIITGDSYGADLVFTNKFLRSKVLVYNVTNSLIKKVSGDRIIVSRESLDEVKNKLNSVKSYMGIHKKHNNYVIDLLCKCYYQIHNSDMIFLIGKFNECNKAVGAAGYMVYFNDFFLGKPLVLYDQDECSWYVYNENRRGFHFDVFKCFPKNEIEPYFEYGNVFTITCSGNRTINKNGKNAISKIHKFIMSMKSKYI